jgi:molybdopterin molybdotransferase
MDQGIPSSVVAIIATGDELIRPGNLLTAGKTYNSNTITIASLVKHFGGIPRILGIARDREADLVAKIRRGVKADAIITSGGVSKGDYDLVRLVLEKTGRLVFSRIRMGPGASVAFGTVERQNPNNGNVAVTVPVFSLSGPPVGCLINFETLVRPALLKMLGFRNLAHPSVEAIALNAVPRRAAMSFVKYTHLRETKEGYMVAFNDAEKMGMTASIAGANSLTIIPEGTVVEAGDKIRVLPLDWHWS